LPIDRMHILKLPRGNGLGVVHPHSLYVIGDSLPYWLYYTPYPPDDAELPFLVKSSDGINFSDSGVNNPLLDRGGGDSWDGHHLADVDVVKHGKRWYMYYAGASYKNNFKMISIGLATSDDGVNWVKFDGNPILSPDSRYWWESGTTRIRGLSCPTVFVYDGIFYMYYAAIGRDGISRISLAVSSDGISFRKVGVVLEPTYSWELLGMDHPHVSIYRDKIVLLYLGHSECTRSLGIGIGSLKDPKKILKSPEPLFSTGIGRKLCFKKNRLIKSINLLSRAAIKYVIARFKRNTGFFTGIGALYRSSFLTYPNKDIVVSSGNARIYISAYDILTNLPAIGVSEIEIGRLKQFEET